MGDAALVEHAAAIYVNDAGLNDKGEMRSAVVYVGVHLEALCAQWGSAVTEKQAERAARDAETWGGEGGSGASSVAAGSVAAVSNGKREQGRLRRRRVKRKIGRRRRGIRGSSWR